jgi:hypothetical protein
MKLRVIPKRCGLPKLSDDLKNFAAGRSRASAPKTPFETRAKPSSDEDYLPAGLARVCVKTQLVRYSNVIFNAEDAEDFAEERKGGLSSANLCENLRALCV